MLQQELVMKRELVSFFWGGGGVKLLCLCFLLSYFSSNTPFFSPNHEENRRKKCTIVKPPKNVSRKETKLSAVVKRHGMTHIEMSIEEQPNPQQRPEDVPPSVVVVQRFHCISITITGHYVVSLQKVVGKEMIVGQTSRYTIGINIGYKLQGVYLYTSPESSSCYDYFSYTCSNFFI